MFYLIYGAPAAVTLLQRSSKQKKKMKQTVPKVSKGHLTGHEHQLSMTLRNIRLRSQAMSSRMRKSPTFMPVPEN